MFPTHSQGVITLYKVLVSQSAEDLAKAARRLGVVTGRHQQVREHQQLVVGEALPVLLPVVVVSAPELRQGLLHRHLGAKNTLIIITDTMEKIQIWSCSFHNTTQRVRPCIIPILEVKKCQALRRN